MELTSFAFDTTGYIEYQNPFFQYNDRIFRIWSKATSTSISFDTITMEKSEIDIAFRDINRFLLLFGWANNISFQFRGTVCMSCPNKRFLLKRKGPLFEVPGKIPVLVVKFELISQEPTCPEVIPALYLYNDGNFSTNTFFQFLRFYQILETKRDLDGKTWLKRNKESIFGQEKISKFEQENGSLEVYLKDECRNAIVHITRFTGKTELDLTSYDDYYSIIQVIDYVRKIGKYFIENRLQFPQNALMRPIKFLASSEISST